jgi:hypothetical protein
VALGNAPLWLVTLEDPIGSKDNICFSCLALYFIEPYNIPSEAGRGQVLLFSFTDWK